MRAALLAKQRELIAAGDYVVEGRDIGTVVAPDAPVKVFLTADPAERARRRAAELERRGLEAEAEEVAAAIEQRDRLDSTRSAAPLRAADDAVVIDTTGLDADAGDRAGRRRWSSGAGLEPRLIAMAARSRRSPWSAIRTSASRRSSTG